MPNIEKMLRENNIPHALEDFLALSKEEQLQTLTTIAEKLNKSEKQNSLSVVPKSIAIIRRELKENVTYQDFINAWTPPGHQLNKENNNTANYFSVPVQVVNGQHKDNPQEILNIGLVDCEPDKVMDVRAKHNDTEEQRRDKIEPLVKQTKVDLYRLLGVYTLGKN